jgi:hypothetical protein
MDGAGAINRTSVRAEVMRVSLSLGAILSVRFEIGYLIHNERQKSKDRKYPVSDRFCVFDEGLWFFSSFV